MKAYRINFRRFEQRAGRYKVEPEQALAARVLLDGYHTDSSLKRMGFSSRQIQGFMEDGTLYPCEVGGNEANSLRQKDRLAEEPGYRDELLSRLRKAWSSTNIPTPEKRRKYLKRARFVRDLGVMLRRRTLMSKVILPEFGVEEDGEYRPPESICVSDLVHLMETRYRILASEHYRNSSHRQFSWNVWYDVKALGIRPANHAETGPAVSRRLREKAAADPVYSAGLRARAENATRARLSLYEKKPELLEESARRSAETRRGMMAEDAVFRSQVMSSLSLGADALWEKAGSDPDFRARLLKKQKRSLEKGRQTIMRRAERRRKALLRYVLEPEFGWPCDGVGPAAIEPLLDGRYTRVRDRYYAGMNVGNAIKRDIAELRACQPAF